MKITKKQLKQLIKEEMESVLSEVPRMPAGIPGGEDPLALLRPVVKSLCAQREQVQQMIAEATDAASQSAAVDQLLKMAGVGWVQRTAIKLLGPRRVLAAVDQLLDQVC